jgi:phage shock protein E
MLKKYFLLSLLFSIFNITLYALDPSKHPSMKLIKYAKQHTKSMSAQKLYQLINEDKEIIMLDVREVLDRAEGQIYADEFYAITRGDLEFNIFGSIQDMNATIVTYCRGGKRGILAAYTLKQLGFKNVMYLEGGMKEWAKSGYPIETTLGVTRLIK